MVQNKEALAEKRGELVGVLTAISAVSKQLARDLTALERRWEEQTEGGEDDDEKV